MTTNLTTSPAANGSGRPGPGANATPAPSASASAVPAAEAARSATPAATTREPSKLRVRPYVLTGGRTKSEVGLALETTLETTEQGRNARRGMTLEPLMIVDACHDPVPLVELAARLGLPLQVLRVLVGDLVTEGLVEAHAAPRASSERPDLALLERVLDGLQNL